MAHAHFLRRAQKMEVIRESEAKRRSKPSANLNRERKNKALSCQKQHNHLLEPAYKITIHHVNDGRPLALPQHLELDELEEEKRPLLPLRHVHVLVLSPLALLKPHLSAGQGKLSVQLAEMARNTFRKP